MLLWDPNLSHTQLHRQEQVIIQRELRFLYLALFCTVELHQGS